MILPGFLGLDTNCFIYYSEGSGERFDLVAAEVFDPLLAGSKRAVASTLTLAELLVPDLRSGDHSAAQETETAFLTFPSLLVSAVSVEIARIAAELRATHRLRLVDATHVATAMFAGADGFLTNDRELLRAAEVFPIFVIDDLIG